MVKDAVRHAAGSRWGKHNWRRLKRWIDGERFADLDPRLAIFWERTPPEEWDMLTKSYDDTTPLPADAHAELRADHPRLRELRSRYRAAALDAAGPWTERRLEGDLNLAYFRGDSPYVWQYRDLPRAARLKFFLFAQYVRERDHTGLLEELGEDGAFGCWTYRYPNMAPVSRDLLDSVNELLFLDRNIGILDRPGLRILDIGAGYGRLAWRTAQAVDGLTDYCCVDAIAESTFLCEYYLHHRGVVPPARVLPFDKAEAALENERFDLVVNVHSFSECSFDSVAEWCEKLERIQAPYFFIVPNHDERFLSIEPDGSRRDFRPLIEKAGYELVASEPVLDDDAVRELVGVNDYFHLFKLRSAD